MTAVLSHPSGAAIRMRSFSSAASRRRRASSRNSSSVIFPSLRIGPLKHSWWRPLALGKSCWPFRTEMPLGEECEHHQDDDQGHRQAECDHGILRAYINREEGKEREGRPIGEG